MNKAKLFQVSNLFLGATWWTFFPKKPGKWFDSWKITCLKKIGLSDRKKCLRIDFEIETKYRGSQISKAPSHFIKLLNIWLFLSLQRIDAKIEESDALCDKADDVFEEASKVLDNYKLIPLDEFLGIGEGFITSWI